MARKKTGSKQQKPAEDGRRSIATNRKARHDYEILSKLEAGLKLVGSEVKSIRQQGATIREGFARMERGELWLHGIHIPLLPQASRMNHEPDRARKLLVHRRELAKIAQALEAKGLAVVPLALYWKGIRIKVELGVGRGRRKGDRRAAEREKEDRKRIRDATRH